ncbi:MAG: hypothetical protein KC420_07470 [Myxococcales bacterium]|nr:hypothetical protein [Myxococcales bacterium]
MALVRLITTGVMEEKALASSLRRLFPAHDFESKPHLDGFTSSTLPPPTSAAGTPRNVDKFAATLIGAFAPGNRRDRPRPDFVVAVDDVELCNALAPDRITATLRDAIIGRLDRWPANARTLTKLREDLQTRASFHLMAPMTEAYFFTDPEALARATAPALDHPNRFDADASDVESFAVDDPDYLNEPSVNGCRWRTQGGRQGHPKRYLIFLTNARYREAAHGVAALRELDWCRVTRHRDRARFARSLLADLVDMLGPPEQSLADAVAEGETHPLTWPGERSPVLRNI